MIKTPSVTAAVIISGQSKISSEKRAHNNGAELRLQCIPQRCLRNHAAHSDYKIHVGKTNRQKRKRLIEAYCF